MTDRQLFILFSILGILAFSVGIWAGLGYPGLYDRYESGGKAPRKTPFEMLVDWIYGKLHR